MRKSFVSLLSLVLFLGVLLTVGCGGGGGGGGSSPVATTSDGSLADLKGRVTYNGNAVPKATVFLTKTTSDEAELSRRASILNSTEPDFSVLTADGTGYQTTSDANGYYSFTQIPVGTYTVQALISSSIQVSQPVVLGAISNLDLALKPTGSISGKITMDGDPVQGIVYLDGTSYMSIAGLDGSFKIMNVPVETTPYTLIPVIQGSYYSVRASSANASTAGQAPAQPAVSTVQGSVRASSAGIYTFKNAPVKVTPIAGQDYPLGTLELVAAEATITGIAKIPGATDNTGITVSTDGGSTETDANGNYTLEGIPYGQRTISFSGYYNGKNYTTSTSVLVDSSTKAVDAVNLLSESATTAKIDVSLIGLADSDYVSFELWQQDDSSPTRSNGSYSPATFPYTGLEPGTYYVKIYPGSDYSLLNPAAGSADLLASVTVAAGGNASFVARLQYNKADLTVTITGINNYFTNIYNPTLSSSYSSVSYQGLGIYKFIGVSLGASSLTISGQGYQSKTITTPSLVAGNNTLSVAITPTFPIVTSISTTGQTLNVGGSRLTNTNLYLTPQGGYRTYYSANHPSDISLTSSTMPPGVYTVEIQGTDYAIATQTGTFTKPFTVAPTSLTGTPGTASYVLNWNSPTEGGAIGYEVSQGGVASITLGNVNTYTFTGLSPNTSYTFFVRAIGSGGIYSPSNSIAITTNKVFATPVLYDSQVYVSNPVRSFLKNGVLYVLDENAPGTNYYLVRYDLNSPTTTAQMVNIMTPAEGIASPTDLYVDDNNYVYVGWASGTYPNPTVAILEQYQDSPTAFPVNPVRTFSRSFNGMSYPFGIKVMTDPNNSAQLAALSWGDVVGNVASITYLAPTTLTQVGAEKQMNFSTLPQKFEWIKFTGGDSAAHVAMLYTYPADPTGNLVVYDKTFTTKYDSVDSSNMAIDITSSPNTGYVWNDTMMHYRNTPATYGVQLPMPGQCCMDSSNNYYIYSNTSGTFTSLARYTSKGVLISSTEFVNEYVGAFGKKLIHYDNSNSQIVIITRGQGGYLQAMTFSTQD